MARFQRAVEHVLRHEGGYTEDTGGRTNYGISEEAHPEAWQDGPPTERDARRVYRREYWQPLQLSKLVEQPLADKVLDVAVNVGPERAVRWLQAALNDVRELYERKPIAVDGLVGPETLGAQRDLKQPDVHQVIARIAVRQLDHYARLAASAPDEYLQYLNGWRTRAAFKVVD